MTDWRDISGHAKLTIEFIREFKKRLDWDFLVTNPHIKIDQDFIHEFKNEIKSIDWSDLTMECYFEKNLVFLDNFKEYVDWKFLSGHRTLSDECIKKFSKYLNWRKIWKYQTLNETTVRENLDKINFEDWPKVSENHKLSEDFIREFQDQLNWDYLQTNEHLNLSDDFKKEFCNKTDWYAESI